MKMNYKKKPNDPSSGSEEISKHLAPSPQDWTKVLGSFRRRLQRHASSYNGDSDDDPFFITILTTASEEVLSTTLAECDNEAVGTRHILGYGLRRDSKSRALSKSDSNALNKIHKPIIMADDKITAGHSSAEAAPVIKRSPRHGPTLARLQRIESEMGPDPADKIIRTNSMKLTAMRQAPLTSSFNKSDSDVTKRAGSSAVLESIEKLKTYKGSDDLRDVSTTATMATTATTTTAETTATTTTAATTATTTTAATSATTTTAATTSTRIPQILSPEITMSFKDANPKNWIAKSVSKMISDKSLAGGEKKRSKSPSGLLEYAQRRLPKWASFIKKSDDDSSSRSETEKSSRPTSHSFPETEQASTSGMTSPVAGTSQNQSVSSKEQTVTKPGECRWFVSDEEQNQTKSESATCEQYNTLTKAHSFEPNGQSLSESFHPTSKSYSFSFFKGKESRESNKDSKQKGKSLKGSQHVASKGKKLASQSSASKASPGVLHVEHDIRSKSVSPVNSKSHREKSKYFCKQKSKDKEPVRKNSITFGNLREKYNIWSKGSCSSRDKAVSAEVLESVRLESPAGKSQGEFLVASMRIFLVVSPPATRMQVRSRSLNNLDCVEAHGSSVGVPPSPGINLARLISKKFFSSTPELNAINHTRDIPYTIGATKGKAAFVRCSRNRLRHTYSQGSPKDFLRLSLPSVFDRSASLGEKTSEYRKHLESSVYVPALGGTSLRSAAQWGSICGPLMSDSSSNFGSDYTVTLPGVKTPLPLDNTDAALLAGKTVKLSEAVPKATILQKAFGQKAVTSRMFSTSTDENYGRWRSGGAGGPDGRAFTEPDAWPPEKHDLKVSGFSQKINQTWTSIFGSKSDPGKMEKLVKKLNDMSEKGVPLLPGFRREHISDAAREALLDIQDKSIEWIFDISNLSEKELKRQRVIFELITTEASFIGHMRTVVELFYSVAHELQQEGILTEVDNKRIFYNITDILNVNIAFWANSIYPMLEDAMTKNRRFNTQYLYDGFYAFRENFHPYELYVQEQKKIQKYSKEKMETCEIYNAFLKWCESQKECKRLKLTDILVKPMQRLTKYTLLLNVIYDLTDYEPERMTIKMMYRNTKKYIYEVNTAIRFKEESEILARVIDSIESYDAVEVRDDEIERLLRRHYDLDLRGSILGCDPLHRRTLILEGDIKFRDNRDVRLEARGFLLTDMLLIAIISKKKKGNQPATYRIIRQKFMVDKLRLYPQYHTRDGVTELSSLVCIIVDETGTATGYFTLHELTSSRESNPTLKRWELAIREAQATLVLARNLYREPREDYYTDTDSLSDHEPERRDENHDPVQAAIERAAKRRLATMVHGAAVSMDTDNTEDIDLKEPWFEGATSTGVGRGRGISRASSRASRLSSLQQSYSGSYETSEWAVPRRGGSADTSTDRRTTSVSSDESVPPPLSLPPSEYQHSIDMLNKLRSRSPSQRVLQQLSTPRIAEAHVQSISVASGSGSPHTVINIPSTSNTLTVQTPHGMSVMQSLPNLTSGQISPAITTTAHQVSLNVPQGVLKDRNRQMYLRTGLPAGALTSDTRGTSYPPPSPTRASLRRGFAFSSTTKNPPLSKTKHVSRESVYSHFYNTKIDNKGVNKGASTSRGTGSSSPLETINANVRSYTYLNIPSESPGESDVEEPSRQTQSHQHD